MRRAEACCYLTDLRRPEGCRPGKPRQAPVSKTPRLVSPRKPRRVSGFQIDYGRIVPNTNRCETGLIESRESISMAINAFSEKLLTLAEAACHIPPINGKKPHVATIWRWIRKGITGIKLEHLKLGGRIVVSEESLQRFFTAIAAAEEQEFNSSLVLKHAPLSPQAHREKEISRSEAALDRRGVSGKKEGRDQS